MRKREATWDHAQWTQLWATLLSACHGHLLGLESLSPEAFSHALLHHRPLTPDGLTPQPFYTRKPFTPETFTPEEFYTKDVLHHNPFYAAKLLSTRESLLHQNQSTQTLHTRNFLHQRRFPSDPGLTWMRIVSYVSCNPGWCFKFVSPWNCEVSAFSSPLLSSPLLSSPLLLSSTVGVGGQIFHIFERSS